MRNPKAFIYNEGRLKGNETWAKKPVYGTELLGMKL